MDFYHVWTRGGGKDRRFRMGLYGQRKSSGVVLCGALVDGGIVLSQEAARANVKQAQDFPHHIKSHVCPACAKLLSELEP